ncbi:MAG: cobalamin biosynthesis protein, partial [Candidatus Rokuibacteriota bacterium]
MIAPLAAALLLDLLAGDPPNRWHPVAWMGHALATGRRRLAHGGPLRLFLAGAAVVLAVAAIAAVAGWAVVHLASALGWAGVVLEALALKATFSLRGLDAGARA